ncbi:hypothetical protein XNC1_3897 [Xenorhabdus nematophila ATCC 19061]|uniref:Uncharacterized protein n=1 Tax=Xenorhabdus nematophila (strain ATCC 19061 / DSM 3370 / CCUG 14189 / LMG 1036 / NCIMB 9965 / AN6) TaxID=406817 RepID=D3VBT6_XENNA|nr:hypothetical protein XNC1_3897 [Xenorhabdus nematophila ATCC 19061]CEE90659.1 hypothetical protein XNA1_1670027 [Xenorhabdus nematophila str. Anatoliense]CEF28877.1 hypothetical protein XNW1_1430001 [Xenorhabdus nematophila str. Websteri]CEK24741.1 hypothetical protein XNC2_3750 [Xenorhabdus nematophila AN6/1]CEE92972.1 hypothetical protein XNA1_3210027 [Xenorhabdus nematophila str. Anatoliense]
MFDLSAPFLDDIDTILLVSELYSSLFILESRCRRMIIV